MKQNLCFEKLHLQKDFAAIVSLFDAPSLPIGIDTLPKSYIDLLITLSVYTVLYAQICYSVFAVQLYNAAESKSR